MRMKNANFYGKIIHGDGTLEEINESQVIYSFYQSEKSDQLFVLSKFAKNGFSLKRGAKLRVKISQILIISKTDKQLISLPAGVNPSL